jgi:hypothetical protein
MHRFYQASARGSAHSKYTGLPFKTEPKMPSQAPLAADTAFKYLTFFCSYPCQRLWELLQKPIKHPIASPIEQSRKLKVHEKAINKLLNNWGRSHRLRRVCTKKMMHGNFWGIASGKMIYAHRYAITFNEGKHIWEGPIACLMLVHFLTPMSIPYMFLIAGVFTVAQSGGPGKCRYQQQTKWIRQKRPLDLVWSRRTDTCAPNLWLSKIMSNPSQKCSLDPGLWISIAT